MPQKPTFFLKNGEFPKLSLPVQFLAFTPKLLQTDFQPILCFLRNEFIFK